jgi:hypothetical protein
MVLANISMLIKQCQKYFPGIFSMYSFLFFCAEIYYSINYWVLILIIHLANGKTRQFMAAGLQTGESGGIAA